MLGMGCTGINKREPLQVSTLTLMLGVTRTLYQLTEYDTENHFENT